MDSVVDRAQSTEFRLEYEDHQVARVITQSLREEIDEIDGDRSTTTLARDGETVIIQVDAADLVALRASMNTWLSLASVAEQSVSVAENHDTAE